VRCPLVVLLLRPLLSLLWRSLTAHTQRLQSQSIPHGRVSQHTQFLPCCSAHYRMVALLLPALAVLLTPQSLSLHNGCSVTPCTCSITHSTVSLSTQWVQFDPDPGWVDWDKVGSEDMSGTEARERFAKLTATVCVCVCLCIHTCVCVCTYMCVYVCMYVCVFVYTYIPVCVCVCVCMLLVSSYHTVVRRMVSVAVCAGVPSNNHNPQRF